MQSTHEHRGFTLIELLVVIAVIGLLSAVVLASLNTARVKARNAARVEAIVQLRTALNFYASVNNGFPASGGYACVSSGDSCGSYSHIGSVDTALAPYIKPPIDPPGGSRAATGIMYWDPATWSGGTVGGIVFPSAYYLGYFLEPPYINGMCGPGVRYASDDGTYIYCMLQLN